MMTESFYKKWQKENALVKDPSFDSELGIYRPVNMDGEVLNYDGSLLNGKEKTPSQTFGRKVATRVFNDGDDVCVQYHDTIVVRFNKKEINLNTGGWNTQTSKKRMNEASKAFGLGYCVSSRKGQWLVEGNRPDGSSYSIPFNDLYVCIER